MGIILSERWVRNILYELEKDGWIKRIGTRPSRYIPLRKIRTISEFIGKMETSEEISGRKEEEEFRELVAEHILKLVEDPIKIVEKIQEHAVTISNHNPKEELIEMAKYLCHKFHEYLDKLSNARTYEDEKKYEEYLRLIENLVQYYYTYVLAVPTKTSRKDIPDVKITDPEILCEDKNGILKEPIAIWVATSSGKGRRKPTGIFVLNVKNLRNILEHRITDDKIVVKTKITDPKEIIYVSGHDTSRWPIDLNELYLPELLGYPVPGRIHVLAGIRYSSWLESRGRTVRVAHQIIPKPEELGELKSEEAIRRGYIVFPDMVGEGHESRLVEAAMNILEYSIIEDEISGKSISPEGPPPIAPRPILHDGRLFPYEHKLSDYAGGYRGWHPELVRTAIQRFSVLVRAVKGDPRLTIVGVVKRARAPYIHPLLLWILRKNGIIDDEVFLRRAASALFERLEASILLSTLYKKEPPPPGYTYRTFGMIRRFWSMDLYIMKAYVTSAKSLNDEYDVDFWLLKCTFGSPELYGYGLRGYLEEHGIESGADEILSFVLANASVVMTYILPPGIRPTDDLIYQRILLPRIEVLVPPPENTNVISQIKKKLDFMAIPIIEEKGGILYGYLHEAVTEEIGNQKRLILMILPYHIVMSDEYAKKYDEQLRMRYYTEILHAIANIARSRGKGTRVWV